MNQISAHPFTVLRSFATKLRSLYVTLPSDALRQVTRRARRATYMKWRQARDAQTKISEQIAHPQQELELDLFDWRAWGDQREAESGEIDAVKFVCQNCAPVKLYLHYDASYINRTAIELAERCERMLDTPDETVVLLAKSWFPELQILGKTPELQRKRLNNRNFWRRVIGRLQRRAIETGKLAAGRVGNVQAAIRRAVKTEKRALRIALRQMKQVVTSNGIEEAEKSVQAAAKQIATRAAGKIRSECAPYASRASVMNWRKRMDSQKRWMKATTLETIDFETGEIIRLNLLELSDKRTKQRYAEILAMIDGMQKLADQARLIPAMLTLTLPGAWHANPQFGHRQATGWNGKTPDQGQKELSQLWARLRAALAQHGTMLSGIRVVEPQEDGTVHWHCLIFQSAGDIPRIEAETLKRFPGKLKHRERVQHVNDNGETVVQDIITMYDSPAQALTRQGRLPKTDNEGAQVEVSIINTQLCSAASYVTKYLLKHTGNETGKPIELQEQVAAFHSVWNIRACQFFGVKNALTDWRELRRLSEKQMTKQGIARELWEHAKAGNAFEFLKLLGGLASAPTPQQAIMQGSYGIRINEYGEQIRKINGVTIFELRAGQPVGSEMIQTRLKEWAIVRAENVNMAAEEMLRDFRQRFITVVQSYPSNQTKVKTNQKTNTHHEQVTAGGGSTAPPQ